MEVILNGTYIGLYILSETIRIDDNKVEIFEQPDENEDFETLVDGCLVEIDNNSEVIQVKLPQPQNPDQRQLWVTPHTLVIISDIQYN